jgi:hypothetical protein
LRKLIMGAAVALPLALAGTAQADTVTTTFDGFNPGTVNGQDGWKVTGPYDQSVVGVPGDMALRISNAITAGSFDDMTFSKPVTKAASENEANNVLVNTFTVKAPDTFVPGLIVSISPDDGRGSRMSYLRLEDHADGVKVFWRDATFTDQLIATLDRSALHTFKLETTFVKGDDNDVVRVTIDGDQKVRGASWENYFRSFEERNPSASDRLLIRTAGTAAPLTSGSGFLFDDVTSTSSHVNNPAPLTPPVIPVGPAGAAGTDGANGTDGVNGRDGVDGKDGAAGPAGKDDVPMAVRANTVVGSTIRTLHVRKVAGMRFISARASLRGKSVQTIRGRTIKVDLRGKSVGRYRMFITARYKAHGKIYKVHSTRSLRIVQK